MVRLTEAQALRDQHTRVQALKWELAWAYVHEKENKLMAKMEEIGVAEGRGRPSMRRFAKRKRNTRRQMFVLPKSRRRCWALERWTSLRERKAISPPKFERVGMSMRKRR